jgi:(S)-citramalyl-CoA lyase
MTRRKLQKSILSLKSWLFTPATKSDRFSRAVEVRADALIIDLEDAVAPSAKNVARATALRYLAEISANHLPCALRINSPDTKFGLDDLQALLSSLANPDYLVLPKCGSSALIGLAGKLLREAGKTTQIIARIMRGRRLSERKPAVTQGQSPISANLRTAVSGFEAFRQERSRFLSIGL